MKKLTSIFLILLFASTVFATLPDPNSYFKFNDYADTNAVLNNQAVATGLTAASYTKSGYYTLTAETLGTAGNNIIIKAKTDGTLDAWPYCRIGIGDANGDPNIVIYYHSAITAPVTKMNHLITQWNATDEALAVASITNLNGESNSALPAISTYAKFSGGTDLVVPPHGTYHGYDIAAVDYNVFVYDSNNGASLGAHQGVAYDGTYYYIIHTNWIKKYDKAWNLQATNSDIFTQARAITPETGSKQYNHLGDGTVYDGVLYVPMEYYGGTDATDFNNQRIVRLQTSDLTVIGCNDISAKGHEVAGYHVDADYIYCVSYDIFAPAEDKIYKYNRTTLVHDSNITLSSGLYWMQGITSDGNNFYICAYQDSVYQVSLTGTVNATSMYVFAANAIEGPEWLSDQNKMAIFHDSGTSIGKVHFLKYEDYNIPTVTAGRSVAGVDGNALSFNGVHDYVDLEANDSGTIRGDSTWSAWLKSDDGQGAAQYLFDANAVDNRFTLKLNTDGTLTFAINSNGDIATITSSVVFDNGANDWKLITATADQTDSTHVELKIYVNGVLRTSANSQTCTLSAYTNSDTIKIGCDYTGAQGWFFDGTIDDFRIYNSALSGNDVATLYCPVAPTGDLNGDCQVNLFDMAVFANGYTGTQEDYLTLKDIAETWLNCGLTEQGDCWQ